jgi:L-gulono-1,4-lactone dehydrogenase
VFIHYTFYRMSQEHKFLSKVKTINLQKDDDRAIDSLINDLNKLETTNLLEEGEDVPEIKNFTKKTEAEYFIKENEFITNPSGTWDFAKTTTILSPYTLQGVVNAVKYVETNQLKVRGLGSRHSFSPVTATDHCYIDLSKTFTYSRAKHNETVKDLDQSPLSLLKDGVESKNYFNVPGGMNIHMINHVLCPDNNAELAHFGQKRMYNMGGGDVQTFAGAFSTGTHGSGGKYSAYHDMVRSIVVVAAGGKVYRVEPNDGLTSPTKHNKYYQGNPRQIKPELIQDDDKFYSLLVSMGCFGIIYSAIIEIADMTMLYEEITYHKSGWNDKLKQTIEKPVLPEDPNKEYFYYVQVNPYKLNRKRNNSVLIKVATPTSIPGSAKRENRRNLWPSLFANSGLSTKIIRTLANSGDFPKKRFIETSLKSRNDNRYSGNGYADLAYKIWNGGNGKLISFGTAIEVAFPTEKVPEVMELIFATLEVVGKMGRGYYLNAPIALRFVRPSKAYLAHNYYKFEGKEVKEWCYVEIIRVNSGNPEIDKKELEIFQHFQQMLYLKGGRPHWGLNFRFNFTQDNVQKLYPEFEKWCNAYRFFNASGVFANEFSRSIGLSSL